MRVRHDSVVSTYLDEGNLEVRTLTLHGLLNTLNLIENNSPVSGID